MNAMSPTAITKPTNMTAVTPPMTTVPARTFVVEKFVECVAHGGFIHSPTPPLVANHTVGGAPLGRIILNQTRMRLRDDVASHSSCSLLEARVLVFRWSGYALDGLSPNTWRRWKSAWVWCSSTAPPGA